MTSIKQNKDVVEFLTVAAEYCAFLEQTEDVELNIFCDRAVKLLSLLYLKATVLPEFEEFEDEFVEKYVTEQDWNIIHTGIIDLFGAHETYFNITEPRGISTGETINVSISEAFADIFQDLRDFVQVYREGSDESVAVALNECKQSFKEYWGVRVIGLMQELHILLYGGVDLNE